MSEEMSVEDARRQFADLVNRAQWQGRHVTLMRHGRRAAVLVPTDWYDRAVAATPASAPEDLA